jgi:arabinogalactan endo-1,4-beta-galactosidase
MNDNTHRCFASVLCLVLASRLFVAAAEPVVTAPPVAPFLIGADISWVPQQEAEGRRFSVDGSEKDILIALREQGFNLVRLRLFNDPAATNGYSARGYCGIASTLALASRVKQAGMKFLLDFHYSDTWADPAHQSKPAAWRHLGFDALTNAVYEYTRDTLCEFAAHGLMPDFVQVGNEVSNGLLWPEGKSENFETMAALLRAGISGVRTGAPAARVMIHLAWGGQNEKSRWYLDKASAHGLSFDIIGQSYYPRWHGTLQELKSNLTDLAQRYPQNIMLVEYSTPGQREVNEIVRGLPGGKGIGTCIWEPTHPRHGNLFDGNGRALPALKEYPTIAAGGSVVHNDSPSSFQNPINPGPDPWMLWHDSNYYLTTTQGDCIRIWKAPSLASFKTSKPVTVWRDSDPSRSRGIWAPEFHFITNRWYLYYTATSSDGADQNHRMHVLESEATDPLGPYHYKGRLVNPTNDHYAIDGSVFQKPGDGSWYFLWAAQPGHVITIARMANPWTLQGHGVVIPASGFGCAEVREGPLVLRRNGKLFLVYSACDTGKPDYKLGMLVADETADLMDPRSWVQFPRPVFQRSDVNGVFGPGHNGFFRSPDGKEDWIVYHGKTSSEYTYRGRSTRAQKFTWNEDGTPNFGVPLSLDAVLQEPSGTR